jgi:Domain of unknown function (DUF4232)
MSKRLIITAALAATAALAIASSGAALGQGASSTSTPRCTSAALAVWIGVGEGTGAAGSNYYPLELTNVSGGRCHLFGFPGVSAWDGRQDGSAAARETGFTPHTVTLAPRASAHAVLQIVNAGNFSPSACRPVTAGSLKVYPPNARRAQLVPFQFSACSAKGPIFLRVRPVQPRVGVPGH